MSRLLEDLIKQKRDDTRSYEEFLAKAEELARKVVRKNSGAHPGVLEGRAEAIVLFHNLEILEAATFKCPADEEAKATLALDIDDAMRTQAPAGWKGDETKERVVLNFLHPLMQRDREATMSLFKMIKKQPGY